MKRSARRLQRILVAVAGVVATVALLPYALMPSFRYPPSMPFSGQHWYNPYEGMQGAWHQVELHAHGLTCCLRAEERRTDRTMAAYYRGLGYDVALVSDHQRLSYIPGPSVYEHGLNVRKTHQLVLGARGVDWLDFPLLQSTDDKQYVLERLRAEAELVGIAHPEIRNGYSFSDLRRLTGYDFMEILHEGFSYEPWWDAALSAGRLSWATGSDDAHNTDNPSKMGLSWTMLRAESTAPAALLRGMRNGWCYAVDGHRGVNDVRLRDLRIAGDTLVVSTDPGVASFTFIGQGGQVRAVVQAPAEARYLLRADDHYIRTVVRTPRTTLYLNPVVRSAGGPPVQARAVPAPAVTWAWRVALLCALAALTWLARRRPSRLAAPPDRRTRSRSRVRA